MFTNKQNILAQVYVKNQNIFLISPKKGFEAIINTALKKLTMALVNHRRHQCKAYDIIYNVQISNIHHYHILSTFYILGIVCV